MRAEGTATPFSSRTVMVGAVEVCAAAAHSRAKSIHHVDTESRRILLIIELAVVRIEQAWIVRRLFYGRMRIGPGWFFGGEKDRKPPLLSIPEKWRPKVPILPGTQDAICVGELLGKPADFGEWGYSNNGE